MKTRFLKVTFVAAIAMIGAINVFNANKTETLSDIALANVEALADDEEEGMGTLYSNQMAQNIAVALEGQELVEPNNVQTVKN